MKTVRTPEELGKAIKEKESYIYVEGDLRKRVIRIKAQGKLAWFVAFSSLATAVGLYFLTPVTTVTTAGTGGAISFTGSATAAATAATILGIPATYVAITIAIAAGGIGAVSTLRNKYEIKAKDHEGIVLKIKSGSHE